MSKVTKDEGQQAPSSTQILAAVPTRRVSGRWISFFALSWFGVWIAQLTPVQLLLPLQVEKNLNATDWVQNVLGFGSLGLCPIGPPPVLAAAALGSQRVRQASLSPL